MQHRKIFPAFCSIAALIVTNTALAEQYLCNADVLVVKDSETSAKPILTTIKLALFPVDVKDPKRLKTKQRERADQIARKDPKVKDVKSIKLQGCSLLQGVIFTSPSSPGGIKVVPKGLQWSPGEKTSAPAEAGKFWCVGGVHARAKMPSQDVSYELGPIYSKMIYVSGVPGSNPTDAESTLRSALLDHIKIYAAKKTGDREAIVMFSDPSRGIPDSLTVSCAEGRTPSAPLLWAEQLQPFAQFTSVVPRSWSQVQKELSTIQ